MGTLTPFEVPGILLKIAMSKVSTGKCAPMQTVKQPVCGRASYSEEENCSSLQMNYNSYKSTIMQARSS